MRIKCLKKMGQIIENYKPYKENSQFLINHASFFKKF